MIFATSGGVSGESGSKPSAQPILDEPLRAGIVDHRAGKIDNQAKRKADGAVPHARMGVNSFALDGLRFMRGNGRQSGGFTRVGLVVLESESAGPDRRTDKQESFGRSLHVVAEKPELSIGDRLHLSQQGIGKAGGIRLDFSPAQYRIGEQTNHPDSAPLTIRAELRDLSKTAGHSYYPISPQLWEHSKIVVPKAIQEPDARGPSRGAGGHNKGYALPLLLSFFLGIFATMAVPAALNEIATIYANHSWRQLKLTDIQRVNDPLALPRMYRDDRLFSYLDLAVNRSSKRPFDDAQLAAIDTAAQTDGAANSDPTTAETDPEDHNSLTALDGAAEPGEAGAAQPSLYFDPALGRQVIGSFKTLSFPGDQNLCTDTARSMISDAKANRNALHTLADTKEIKVMRICAMNGAVIVTCRNGQVTISPRRSRPDDGCQAHAVSKQALKAL